MTLATAAQQQNIFRVLAASGEGARARWRVAPPLARERRASSLADAELVAQHLAGDPRAFAELVKRYTNAVYNVTYRFTQNTAEAENLTQETFLRAWHALPRLDSERPLKPYLMKIAVNLCRDWAEQTRVKMVELDADDESLVADDAHDPLQNLSDQELRERVRAKLELLPPLYRTVITLRYSEDMTYEEMATALDLPLNTVRTQLHRAKARLRELLEQDE
jgi:RNA polymerase sigma-70 factor (ECF subfamily)